MEDLQRKIGGALARFMYGRNGWDQLNQALFRGYVVLLIAQLGARVLLRRPHLVHICEILLLVLLAVMLFRAFSKDLGRRREENQRWLSWRWSLKSRSGGARARRADKEHRYFTCKQCRAVCRVPAGKGSIIITCPKCGAQMRAKT